MVRTDPHAAAARGARRFSAARCGTLSLKKPGPDLLRQPGGFEGLRPVFSEVGPPDGLAIAERPQVPHKSLHLSAAHLAASAKTDQHEHLVAGVDQLFDFQ